MEQLSKGPSFMYNTIISDSFLALFTYPMPYALFLASYSMGSAMFLLVSWPYIPLCQVHSLQGYQLTWGSVASLFI